MTKNVTGTTYNITLTGTGGTFNSDEPTGNADVITFTGSGFGTHDLDVEFIGGPTGHLEKTSVGNDSNFGDWIINTNEQVEIVDDGTRGHCWFADLGSGTAAPMRYDRGSGNTIPANGKVYVSWYTKRDVIAGTGQWKMFRMSKINDIQDNGTEIAMFNWNGDSNGNTINIRCEAGPTGGDNVTLFGGDANYPQTDLKWYRMEMLVDTSTQNLKDGDMEVWRHDEVVAPVENSWNFSGEATPKYPTVKTYDTVDRFRWFLWQNYRGNGLSDMHVWNDDLYIQAGTFKRVELCNNATYASATHREIQRITSYSDTVVTAEINVGSFGAGTYYAHLIDESGASIDTETVVIA